MSTYSKQYQIARSKNQHGSVAYESNLLNYQRYEQMYIGCITNGLVAYLVSSNATTKTSQNLLKHGLSKADFEQITMKAENPQRHLYLKFIEQKLDYENLKGRLKLHYNYRFMLTRQG